MRDIECPPYAPSLMDSTRSIGYSIESAVADIIDNSISAGADTVSIFYDTQKTPYIAIVDNGTGMDEDSLNLAMKYGSINPNSVRAESDLGRYGLGLKTASLSQCRDLVVVSIKDGVINARSWNLDHIYRTQKWSLMVLEGEEINKLEKIDVLKQFGTGTMVLWRVLDKVSSGNLTLDKAVEEKMESVKKHLELVFHRYLSGESGIKKIKMEINGIRLNPFDPFMTGRSHQEMDDEKIDIPGRKEKIVVRAYTLPHPNTMTREELAKYGGKDGFRSTQGFYIYRNKRLITWGIWFGLARKDEFTKLTRIMVDIPNSLDDLWTLDVKKSTAYPPEIVKVRLKQLMSTMSKGSKRTWTFRQRKEFDPSFVHVWGREETRDGSKYVINYDHPVLTLLNEKIDDDAKKLLKEYLVTVQESLPLVNLHRDLNSDEKIVGSKADEKIKSIVAMAEYALKEAYEEDDLEATVENLKKTEPFSQYEDIIDELATKVKMYG